ncbi:MAG TPA: MBL fold metallo-hydrolase [Bacteroidales bacterium]
MNLISTTGFYDCNFSFFAYIMPLYITSLNSGSNGNCYYVGNHREAVLIDAGISCRETEKRIARSGLCFNKIRAVFITHEHTDHTRGVEVIARKYQIPVYITAATHKNSSLQMDHNLIMSFKANVPVQIGDLSVKAFPKLHDAKEPHSFTVTDGGITVGILTDIGSACNHVIQNFSQCHAAFLEANYDEVMLEEGRYPLFLKNRIRGDEGHLSNHQALELFTAHKASFMSHLLLSHLSEHNNSPQLVKDLFMKHAGDTNIAIASRHQESAVYCISGDNAADQPGKTKVQAALPIQMSLF